MFSVRREAKGDLEFSVLEFKLGGAISPSTLKGLTVPRMDPRSGVAISGRGPVWLFSYLVHELHPYPWIGVYDPRLGVVIVASHHPKVMPGDVIDITLE